MLAKFDGAPYCEKAYIYANHVVKGHRLACKEETQACQRFLDDLNQDGFAYTLDIDKAEDACHFIEQLPHTKGKWAAQRKNLILEPWQCFIVVNLFGWVNHAGFRRFRDAYLRIPRKNGKSLLAAAIGILLFTDKNDFGAEVYSGATSEKQAWEVFKPAKLMCERTPELCDVFGIAVNAKNLNILGDASKFEPMIGDPGDGSSVSCAIIDEWHEHDTANMVETMDTGMGAREQPLMLKITTSGSNHGGPCYLAELEYRKLLDGVYTDDRTFVLLFGIDEGDDWTSHDALIKANPNYDISVSGEFLQAQQQAAIRSAAKQNSFKRKHLNQWVGAHTAWLNMEHWNRCSEALEIEDFHGETCVFSLDLASRIDITAFLQVFSRRIADKNHYYVFSRFYLPEETVLGDKSNNYESWVNAGLITATDGEEIDFNEIQADVVAEMDNYMVSEVVYDPWRATQLAQGLIAEGATAVEFRNTVGNMSPAMYELEAAITSGRLHVAENAVLDWMASNVISKVDAKDNIFPRKQRPENKIDGMVALIMAVGRLMHSDTNGLGDFLADPVSI